MKYTTKLRYSVLQSLKASEKAKHRLFQKMIKTHRSDITPENLETSGLNGKIQFLNSGDPLYHVTKSLQK